MGNLGLRAIVDWMLGQLGLPEDEADAAGQAAAAAEPAAPEPAAASAAPGRAELRIDDVTITEAGRDLELISVGHLVTAPPGDLRHLSACASPCTAGEQASSCGRPYGSAARTGRAGARRNR